MRLQIRCASLGSRACSGQLALLDRKTGKKLGTWRFQVANGKKAWVRLRLSHAVRARLAHGKALKLRVRTVTSIRGGRDTTRTRTLTIRRS